MTRNSRGQNPHLAELTTVVFDLDGTLVDSAADLLSAVNCVLDELRLAPLGFAEFRRMFGEGVSKLMARALAARHSTAEPAAALGRFLEHYARKLTTSTRPYPGTERTLQTLKARGLQLAVCTNKPTELSRALLAELRLDGYFTLVLGGDALPYRKPDVRVLLEVLTRLGASAVSSLFIGDSEIDAEMAQAADVPFVLMTHGYARGPVADIHCLTALDHFDQLSGFLRGMGWDN